MREIKFRAFCVATQRMFYVSNLGWDYHAANPDGVEGFTEQGEACTWYDTDGTIIHLMQFTGLKDKKLKEIYERDILRFFNETKEFHIGPVVWREQFSIWSVGLAITEIYPEDLWVKECEYEIIGNIYENPDLL